MVRAFVFASAVLLGSAVIPVSSANADDGIRSKLASSLTDFFRRGDEKVDYNHRGLTPPGDLTGTAQPDTSGRIVIAQSKKELGAAIGRNTRAIGENTIRVQNMEEQLRKITGRIEQLTFELQQVQQQLRIMQEEAFLDDDTKKARDYADSSTDDRPKETDQGGTDAHLLPQNPKDTITTAKIPDADKPLDLGTVRRGTDSQDPLLKPNGKPILGTLPQNPPVFGDATTLYRTAYTALVNGDYVSAERSFKVFLQQHPSHELSPKARYWLAETFFARGNFENAVEEFSVSYKTNPTGDKAPDSLLKLGLSLAQLNERDAACATLAEVFNRFPNAPGAIQSAARDGQVQSNCRS